MGTMFQITDAEGANPVFGFEPASGSPASAASGGAASSMASGFTGRLSGSCSRGVAVPVASAAGHQLGLQCGTAGGLGRRPNLRVGAAFSWVRCPRVSALIEQLASVRAPRESGTAAAPAAMSIRAPKAHQLFAGVLGSVRFSLRSRSASVAAATGQGCAASRGSSR